MDLNNKTPRQLIKMKCIIGAHMKKAHAPWTIRKLKIMLDKAILLQEINEVQYERRKETIKLFYEVPEQHRKRNWYTTIREYNIMKTLLINSQQMEQENPIVTPTEVTENPEVVVETPVVAPDAPAEVVEPTVEAPVENA